MGVLNLGLLSRISRSKPELILVCLVTSLPVVITRHIWRDVLTGGVPRAWDGCGHYGAAVIYDRLIFPETLGWLTAYFAGMPFPNFYPPLFYWCVSLLSHTHLISFLTAFKIMISLPILVTPVGIWMLAFAVSEQDRRVATAAAFTSIPFLVDIRAWTGGIPTGLDYYSTFQIGLYSQPLGFVLFLFWFPVYLRTHVIRNRSFLLACLMLALTILGNFFVSIVASLVVVVTLTYDFLNFCKASNQQTRLRTQATLLSHLMIAISAVALAAFWLVPMLSSYDYFVTRPYVFNITDLISPMMWGLYALSAIGFICWIRRPTPALPIYLGSCLVVIVAILLVGKVTPQWFPAQPPRFLGILNFLLAVPAGYAITAMYHWVAGSVGARVDRIGATADEPPRPGKEAFYADAIILLVIVIDVLIFINAPPADVAFYGAQGSDEVQGVLHFADSHRSGRYLVEADLTSGASKFDARAINSYLGAQGNETLGTVFHEASPNALFFLAVANAFSSRPDNFGISSVLAEDLDFAEQSFAQHLKRAKLLGVRYLVIHSSSIKARLSQEPDVGGHHDFGGWTVYELNGDPVPKIQVLSFRPALVVTGFTLKERRRNDYNFIRLAEEQFADGWFDVLLVRSSEEKIDKLNELEQFGALILDSYEYDDQSLAFQKLQDYARRHTLILLSSDEALFKRIKTAIADFPFARIIGRTSSSEPNELLGAPEPAYRYQTNPIRKDWAAIRQVLDETKCATVIGTNPIMSGANHNTIWIDFTSAPEREIPVLISNTYHPNWHRSDGGRIYAATPFYSLTFLKQRVQLIYDRRWFESLALWFSACALLILCFGAYWWRRHYDGSHTRPFENRSELRQL